MTHFLETRSGWINADEVSEVDYVKGDKPYYRATLKGGGTVALHWAFSPDKDLCCLVPAASNHVVTVITLLLREGDIRPAAADILAEEYQVLAWMSLRGWVTPILCQDAISSEAYIFYNEPGGRLVLPEDRSYSSLEEAKNDLLKEWQNRWDERHKDSVPDRHRDLDILG